MVEQYICSFCGGVLEPGTGKMFVKRDGDYLLFLQQQVPEELQARPVPRRVQWTAAGRRARGKE